VPKEYKSIAMRGSWVIAGCGRLQPRARELDR
jgi:hypothetical protein